MHHPRCIYNSNIGSSSIGINNSSSVNMVVVVAGVLVVAPVLVVLIIEAQIVYY